MGSTETETEAPEVEEIAPLTGDVDIADLPKTHHRGEVGPFILPGYWVLLGEHSDVPDRFVGHIAAVIESPWRAAYLGERDQKLPGYAYDKNRDFLVRTRDDANALLTITDEAAFTQVADSRTGLENRG